MYDYNTDVREEGLWLSHCDTILHTLNGFLLRGAQSPFVFLIYLLSQCICLHLRGEIQVLIKAETDTVSCNFSHFCKKPHLPHCQLHNASLLVKLLHCSVILGHWENMTFLTMNKHNVWKFSVIFCTMQQSETVGRGWSHPASIRTQWAIECFIR